MTLKRLAAGVAACSAVLCLGGAVSAQREYGLPAPEPPEAAKHLAAAREAAGTQWRQAYFYFCDPNPRINSTSDPWLPPTKVFDNLYFVGSAGMASWIVQTSAGLVILDAGYPQHVQEVLLDGMAELKLNPADVKYIMAAHGVWDHFGGAAYFQKKYGTRVVMDEGGWAGAKSFRIATWPRSPTPTQIGVPPNYPPLYTVAPAFDPARDVTITGEQVLTVGDTNFTIDRGLHVTFPVKDGATTHIAGWQGSIGLVKSWSNNPALRATIASTNKWKADAKRLNVDVEIENHALFDNLPEKITAVRLGQKGSEHPFVVGIDGYQRFFTVIAECTEVHLARRAAGTALPFNTQPSIQPGDLAARP